MTPSIRQPLTLALFVLALSACLVDRVKVADDKGDSSTNSSIAGMDASSDSSTNGGEAGASTGTEGGSAGTTGANNNSSSGDAQANVDAGKLECATACDTIEASKCDTNVGSCVRCTHGDDCDHLKATPACLPATGCVECVFEDNTAKCNGKTPHCSNDAVLPNTCVECNLASQCGDDAPLCINHKCVSCKESPGEACKGRANKICEPVSGACVQCDEDDRTACKDSANNPTVCDVLEHVCTDKRLLSANACDECVADEQCQADQRCIKMTLAMDDVGFFCLPTTTGNCALERPYFGLLNDTLTIEGETVDACTLRTSTCAAHDSYSGRDCGVNNDADPDADVGDDSVCGDPRFDDGFCVEFQPSLFLCTVGCNNADNDCPDLAGPSDPACTSQTHETGTDPLCAL